MRMKIVLERLFKEVGGGGGKAVNMNPHKRKLYNDHIIITLSYFFYNMV